MNSNQPLVEMKNLGNTTINWLKAVGIQNRQQLELIGPELAYIKIKERGFAVSKVVLYALYGALHDVNWKQLDQQVKSDLISRAEALLTEPVD
jgi:DNA transformation protein